MLNQLELSGIAMLRVADHVVHSVAAIGEPEGQKRRAYADLADALPSEAACAEIGATIHRIATTPDFHPGKPVPVGVVADIEGAVLPHMIGNDIGCGMRMIIIEGQGACELPAALDGHLRHIYFQGGRDLALSGQNRHALLRDGLPGLFESFAAGRKGLLAKLDLGVCWADLDRCADAGVFEASDVDPDFEHYAALDDGFRHDAMLGSIGGGNHFVEIGRVDRIADAAFAAALGISADSLIVVVHSGSLDFGQRIGSATREKLQALKSKRLDHRLLSRDADPELYHRFELGQANAVNAAFANRFFIAAEAVEALSRAFGRELSFRTIYDAPHNAIWIGKERALHRKGACPARGVGSLTGERLHWFGEPVILPGSMGDGSWLLTGTGIAETLQSSAHGAGRRLSRQEARHAPDTLSRLRVVGPVDLDSPAIRARPDVASEAKARLMEEAPSAYRPIDDVVDAMCDAGMVRRAVRIRPMLTVKG
jgi:tRNA-splicing ligase RtcB